MVMATWLKQMPYNNQGSSFPSPYSGHGISSLGTTFLREASYGLVRTSPPPKRALTVK